MKRYLSVILALTLVFCFTAAAGSAPVWEPDPPHTTVAFTIKHQLVPVIGTFDEAQGQIQFDPDNLDASSISIVIPIRSINTRNKHRDQHLLSDDFFHVIEYPNMTFSSTEVIHKGGNEYVARGKLTIKDVTKEIELPFVFKGTADHPFKKNLEVAGFEAKYSLDRLEYNVGDGTWYERGLTGKDVDITLYVEALREKQIQMEDGKKQE